MSAGHDHALVERVHDLAAFFGGDEIGSDDGRDDGYGAEHQGKHHRPLAHVDHDQAAEQHGGDQRDRIGFEQVGRHAGAIADVVADVVGDDRRIARIILRNARFDLADEVGPHIGALGENAAAQTRENRDQRPAECQSDQRAQRRLRIAQHMQHAKVIAGHAQQPQADHQHSRDGPAAEGDFERGIDAHVRRLRGAHIGAHRDEHADVACEAREEGAHRKAAGRGPAEGYPQDNEQDDAHECDRAVLAIQIGACAGLNRGRDFLHARIAGRLREDPANGNGAVRDCKDSGSDCQEQDVIEGHFAVSGSGARIIGIGVGRIILLKTKGLLLMEARQIIPQRVVSGASARRCPQASRRPAGRAGRVGSPRRRSAAANSAGRPV